MSSHALLSFTATYSRCSQIKMDPANEDKIALYIDDFVYCYKVMAFGLKNTGPTY